MAGKELQGKQLADVPDWCLAKTHKRGRGEDQEEEERYRKTRMAVEELPGKFRRSKDANEQRHGMLFDRVFERQDLSEATANAIGAAYDFANGQPNGGWRVTLASASLLTHMGMGQIADQDLADAVDAMGDGHIMRMPEGSHAVQMQHSCIEIGSGVSGARPVVQRYRQQGRSPPRSAPRGRGRFEDLEEEDL